MNNRLARCAISLAKTSEQLFNRDVGTKSNGDDFAGSDLIILATSCTVTGVMIDNHGSTLGQGGTCPSASFVAPRFKSYLTILT